jgi:4-hydroxy-2-oxoheptanedioate aldolase
MSITNGFKQALLEGRRQIGLWQALANPYTAEICAGAGFDWLLFDGEHAPNNVPSMLAQLQAVAPYPSHPIARLPKGDNTLIKQYLDIGFQSLLIPFVETAEQAQALVRATRYPPAGIRGIAPGLARAAKWNRVPNYLDEADAQVCLIVQIETAEGVRNIDAITAVEGVDGIFIGPADLSASLGYRGQANHPDMIATISETMKRVRGKGKPVGTLAMDKVSLERAENSGCTFIAVGTDVSLLSKASEDLAHAAGAANAGDRGGAGGY